MGKPVASRATIKVDGEILLNKNGATFRPGGIERESVAGDSSVHGFTETIQPARLVVNVSATEKSEMDKFDMTDATIQVEDNAGGAWVMNSAWRTEAPELDYGEGHFGLTFESDVAEKM